MVTDAAITSDMTLLKIVIYSSDEEPSKIEAQLGHLAAP